MTDGFVPAPIAQLPWRLLLVVMALAGFGFLVLYSAGQGVLGRYAMPHAIRFCVFMVMAIAISRVREDVWMRIAYPLYGVVLFLLLAVEIKGGISGGSQRWLDTGIIRLQPSELMKLAVVLAVARFYATLPLAEVRRWNGIWPALGLVAMPAALVLLQPDLGTATMIASGGIIVMFMAGLPLRLFVGTGVALLASLPVLYNFLHEYQQKRVLIFLDPESDMLGSGYHIVQSKIAIGSGGLFGKGFLNGTQAKFNYLPEGHTDFAFATMAEEWGMLGGVFVIICYLLIGRWGMRVALRAPTRFGRLTAIGLIMTIFFYFTINLLMVMGFAPVVGIPLPFVSHGGTAMMTVMLCLGVLMSVERYSRRQSSFG